METTPQKPPFPLSSLGAISFFFSFPPALILYGLNWQRLDKPEKAKVPIVLGVIGGVLLIILALSGTELLKITPLLNIAFIIVSYKQQKAEITAYQDKVSKKLGGAFVPLLAGIGFTAILIGSLVLASGLSVTEFLRGVSIAQSKEFKNYTYALDNEDQLTPEKRVELIYPLYMQEKDKGKLGAEVTYNYAIALLDAGKFSEGKDLIEQLYAAYKSDPENGSTITATRNGITLWETPGEYSGYIHAVNELLNKDKPGEALPIMESFHKKFKDSPYLAGMTYYNLTATYANLGRVEEAEQVATEGMQKFPNYIGWKQLR